MSGRYPIEVLREIPQTKPDSFCVRCHQVIRWSSINVGWTHVEGISTPWQRHEALLDLTRLPTSILINLYTVAIDGVVTEMHKAMQARAETVRRTGYRRAATAQSSERQS